MIVRLYGPLSIELIATVITKVQVVMYHVYAYPMNLINTYCTVSSATTKPLFCCTVANDLRSLQILVDFPFPRS